MKQVHKKRFIILSFVLLCICMWCGILLYQSKYSLSCSNYQISSSKLTSELRIVQLSDLHNSRFGEANEKLLSEVVSQSPDLILLTGDMLNMDKVNSTIAMNLVEALCEIAPVYMSLGNHELAYQQNFDIDVTELFESAGAVVLDGAYEDIEINGQKIRIGGFSGYGLPTKYLKTNEADPKECAFLSDFQNTDSYTVLMAHMPVCWTWNEGVDEWGIDCVFSGHAHGGQIILPGIGGVYAPDMGFFPGKLEGLFYSKDNSKVMILSRGLGTGSKVPRFNNVPEVVVVELVCGEE